MDADKSADVLELIQLLRATSHEDLELLWKQLSVNDEHRYLFALLVDQLCQMECINNTSKTPLKCVLLLAFIYEVHFE